MFAVGDYTDTVQYNYRPPLIKEAECRSLFSAHMLGAVVSK